jgi:hypothetical protein
MCNIIRVQSHHSTSCMACHTSRLANVLQIKHCTIGKYIRQFYKDILSPPMTLSKPYLLLLDMVAHLYLMKIFDTPELLDWRQVSAIFIDTIYNILPLDFYIICHLAYPRCASTKRSMSCYYCHLTVPFMSLGYTLTHIYIHHTFYVKTQIKTSMERSIICVYNTFLSSTYT